MRLLIWHVDHFAAEPTERGRSKVADAAPPRVGVDEALVVFAQAERADEADTEGVAERGAEAVARVAAQLKVGTVVLHSFAHLFGELSAPEAARAILDAMQRRLEGRGLAVQQTAFGWFNRLDLRAKGHPLSRQARQI
jgi:threonyl-tRNA synthetase